MANFFSLVKVQLLSFIGGNKLFKSKSKKKVFGLGGIVLLLLLIGAALVFFGYTYSQIFAMSLTEDSKDKLIPLMLAMACLVCFLFSFYAVGSALFGFKDYDMLMSMPIKPFEIVLSKFSVLYISELFFAFLLVIPSLFVYNSAIATVTLTSVVVTVAMCLFAPLLPLAISTLIGVVVYYISSRFRRKNIVQIILLILLMVVIFAFSFFSGMIESEDASQIMGAFRVIEKIYFVMPLAEKAFAKPIWLLVFFAVNFAPLSIIILFVCVFYKKLNTIFTAKRTLRNFKLKEYKTNGINKTLFKKELKRLFSCPVYAVNSLFGLAMALIMGIAYSVFYIVSGAGTDAVGQVVFDIINRILPAMFGFMFLFSPTTCCSISLEGQSFWIIKTAPISHMQVLNAKLYVHALFSTSVAFIISLCMAICGGFGWIGGALFVVFGVGISTFGGLFGLVMNLCFPKLKWENENVPVKQGLPTFLTMVIALIFTAIFIVMAVYVNLSFNALLAIYASFFMIISLVLYIVLYKCGKRMFERLN